MNARLVVSEVPAYVSLYDSRGWRLPSMASRAVTVPLDFFLMTIAVDSTLERGISLRDSYVLECLPSSF